MATPAEVARFHDPAYVAALQRAERTQAVSEADRAAYRIGAEGNPVFAEIYRRPMTSAGGVLLAAPADRAGRHGALPGRRHAPRPAGTRQPGSATSTTRCWASWPGWTRA